MSKIIQIAVSPSADWRMNRLYALDSAGHIWGRIQGEWQEIGIPDDEILDNGKGDDNE